MVSRSSQKTNGTPSGGNDTNFHGKKVHSGALGTTHAYALQRTKAAGASNAVKISRYHSIKI